MTIIQLQYLIEVANCGSFSAASEHCFVTQPSLSMQIKSLEEELGVILLDRSKKPVIPTEAGAVVIAQAQETLKAYNTIRESVAELKGETAGKLRLGVIPTIAPYLLHKFIPDFVKSYPRVELEIREMVTADIVDSLHRDKIDVALVASGTCGTDVSYVLNSDGVLTVSGSGAMTNYRFAGQVPYYAYLEDIKTVIIEDGVTNIGDFAFSGCTSLESINLNNVLFAHFFTVCIFDKSNSTVKLTKLKNIVNIHCIACGDVVKNNAVFDLSDNHTVTSSIFKIRAIRAYMPFLVCAK